VITPKKKLRPIVADGAATAGQLGDLQVVLLIHGIRTHAEWQAMVREAVAVQGQIEVVPIKYGYFDVIRFWFPFWTRSRPIARVELQIRVALRKYREIHHQAKLSIIAHSFGTYIVGRILQKNIDIQVHRLILCGSVLPVDFPWEQLWGRFDDMVVNECGKSDIWPVLAQATSWGYGASGTHGFGVVLVKDRFHAGGHSQYLERSFVEEHWAPFIRRGEYKPTAFEVQKAPPSPWWLSVLGISPLRWIITALLIGLLTSLAPLLTSFVHPEVPKKIEMIRLAMDLNHDFYHGADNLLFRDVLTAIRKCKKLYKGYDKEGSFNYDQIIDRCINSFP
jgi:pimeloyl-ACP methyl ester carboxylesterase